MSRVYWFFIVLLGMVSVGENALAMDVLYTVDSAILVTQKESIPLTLEVAFTPEQIMNGLMHRWQLPERHGMIFLFSQEEPVAFWMKDTFIPLDMLFIDHTGGIAHMVEGAAPLSTDIISSRGAVSAVIELSAGSVRRLHIAKGDKVIYPWFYE